MDMYGEKNLIGTLESKFLFKYSTYSKSRYMYINNWSMNRYFWGVNDSLIVQQETQNRKKPRKLNPIMLYKDNDISYVVSYVQYS